MVPPASIVAVCCTFHPDPGLPLSSRAKEMYKMIHSPLLGKEVYQNLPSMGEGEGGGESIPACTPNRSQ